MKTVLKIASPIILVSAVLALGIADASARGGGGGGMGANHPRFESKADRNAGCPGVALGAGVSCPGPINVGFGTNKPITCKAGGEGCQRQH